MGYAKQADCKLLQICLLELFFFFFYCGENHLSCFKVIKVEFAASGFLS